MEKYSGDSSIRLPLATSRAALLALEAPLLDGQRDHVGRRRTREPHHESLGLGAVLTNTEHESGMLATKVATPPTAKTGRGVETSLR